MRLAASALGLVVVALVAGPAAPAQADPARPTNDRSEVVAVEPPVVGVKVDVVGGDAFLRVRAESGHAVEVPGYDGEPYLRIEPDGTVQQNEHSPSRWINTARYGPTDAPPPEAAVDAVPQWRTVGDGGDHVWHDHRIHSMGGPPQSTTWEVPMTIDGQVVMVRGSLARSPAPSALPWIAVAVAVGATLAAALARRPAPAGVGLLAVGLAAAAVGTAELVALPGDAGSGVSVVAFPAVAVLAATASFLPGPAWLAGPFTVGAGAALLWWCLKRFAVLDHAVLLTDLPDGLDRAVVALALGAGAAATLTGLASALGLVRLARPVAQRARRR